jgi:phosphohistidine phosphatase SixA
MWPGGAPIVDVLIRRPRAAAQLAVAALGVVLAWPTAARSADDAVWELLRAGGQVVLMRHAATTPGAGDPTGFRLDDCATQRNLSEAGREEARRVGAAFASRRVPVGRVLSSRWCRCLETARLAFGRVEPWPALDSIFQDRRREPEQTAAVRALAGEPPSDGNLILVTHGANIAALAGIVPTQGEFLVVTPEAGGRFRVAGRLAPSALE